MGNGGSAAIANHMAADLSKWANEHGPMFRAFSLCENTARTFALGNDLGFDSVFSEQIRLLKPPYVLIAISSSGRSQNILQGLSQARDCASVDLACLTGPEPSEALRTLSDWVLEIQGATEPPILESIHDICGHLLADNLRRLHPKLHGN